MTNNLEIGDILEIGVNKRLVYLGDGLANCETNIDGSGWQVDPSRPDHANIRPTHRQVEYWLAKKELMETV